MVVAIKDGRLLIKKNVHEGKEILQLFGGGTKEDIETLVSEMFGSDYVGKLEDFGYINNTIIKPEEVVHIRINLLRITLSDNAELQVDEKVYEWCSKEVCTSDERGQRDIRLHNRLFEDRRVALDFTEEQLNGWHNAKIILWGENKLPPIVSHRDIPR